MAAGNDGGGRELRALDDVPDSPDRLARGGSVIARPLRGLSVDCRFKVHERDEYDSDSAAEPDEDENSAKEDLIKLDEEKPVITGGSPTDSLVFYSPSDFKRELGSIPDGGVSVPTVALPKASASAVANILASAQPHRR